MQTRCTVKTNANNDQKIYMHYEHLVGKQQWLQKFVRHRFGFLKKTIATIINHCVFRVLSFISLIIFRWRVTLTAVPVTTELTRTWDPRPRTGTQGIKAETKACDLGFWPDQGQGLTSLSISHHRYIVDKPVTNKPPNVSLPNRTRGNMSISWSTATALSN